MIFFITVLLLKRLKCWNTIPICLLWTLILTCISAMSTPLKITCPPVGSSIQFKQRKKVLLPEPDGPMTTMISPRFMVILMPFNTFLSPNCFSKLMTSITFSQAPFHNNYAYTDE